MISASLAAVFAIGCSTNARPDFADGSVFNACWQQCTPDPGGVCQHTCTPDPGPRPVDCKAAEANYIFSDDFIGDFQSANASGFYSYTDNSQVIASFVERQTNYKPRLDAANDFRPARKTWEPPTVPIQRCLDPTDHTQVLQNNALHVQGGPFLSWGGGVGKAMKYYPTSKDDPMTWREVVYDASQWDGLSFWARRGPDSQAGFRVLVGDKNTDDDISYLMYREDPTMPRFCERVRECACLNHMPCAAIPRKVDVNGGAVVDGGATRNNPEIPGECALPDNHFTPAETTMSFCGEPMAISGAEQAGGANSACNTCLHTRCNERYPAYPDDYATPFGNEMAGSGIPLGTDRQFWGKPCMPHTYRNGISSLFCFDQAAGDKVAETTEQCGDHWTRAVNLSNEWQFYTIPFNTMMQQGWAKRTDALDLTTVSLVRFTWDGGWVDFWIDDVRFYKLR